MSENFLEIKKLLPDINPVQIVTDEAPCFCYGFRMVFPKSRAELHHCRWHIEDAAEKLKHRPQLRSRLRKMLRDLVLIEDWPMFQQQFGEVLAFLKNEEQHHMEDYLRLS
ncbi:hypothetical protein V3C99_001626 [Haemonchus contortus]